MLVKYGLEILCIWITGRNCASNDALMPCFMDALLVDVPYELATLSDYIYDPAVSMWCIDIRSMA